MPRQRRAVWGWTPCTTCACAPNWKWLAPRTPCLSRPPPASFGRVQLYHSAALARSNKAAEAAEALDSLGSLDDAAYCTEVVGPSGPVVATVVPFAVRLLRAQLLVSLGAVDGAGGGG